MFLEIQENKLDPLTILSDPERAHPQAFTFYQILSQPTVVFKSTNDPSISIINLKINGEKEAWLQKFSSPSPFSSFEISGQPKVSIIYGFRILMSC